MNVFTTTALWNDALGNWAGIHDLPARDNLVHRSGIRVMENGLIERFLTSAPRFYLGLPSTTVSTGTLTVKGGFQHAATRAHCVDGSLRHCDPLQCGLTT